LCAAHGVLLCWVILFYNVIGIIKHDESALLGVCTTRIKRCRLMIPGNYFATALPAENNLNPRRESRAGLPLKC
jgi:hypothetical protein